MREGSAECERIRGVVESAVCRDDDPTLHRRRSITLPDKHIDKNNLQAMRAVET